MKGQESSEEIGKKQKILPTEEEMVEDDQIAFDLPPQTESVQSQLELWGNSKPPMVIQVGKTEREIEEHKKRLKTVSEPILCQESEEDIFPLDENNSI